MVECCVSVLGDKSGRSEHSHHWFSDHTLITAFMNIHEGNFEMVHLLVADNDHTMCVVLCFHSIPGLP